MDNLAKATRAFEKVSRQGIFVGTVGPQKDLEFIRREEFSTERLTTPPRLKAHSHETQQGVPI